MVELKHLKEMASSLSILYVEDEENIAKTVVNYLSKIFSRVEYAKNGADALEMYSHDNFDIVISDINMPVMNGLKLASKIKELNEKQNFIFVTAFSEIEILLASIKIGVDGYIIKPINFNEFNKLLYKICENIKNSNENQINIEQQAYLLKHISQKNALLTQYTDVINRVAIVSKIDLSGNMTYINDLFCEVSGYTEDELIGEPHNILWHPDMSSEVYKEMVNLIEEGKVWEGTIKNKTKNDDFYFVHGTVIPIIENDIVDSYVGISFLSTNEEVEKREFKKRVRTNLQGFKKSNYDLHKEVDEIKVILSQEQEEKLKSQLKIKNLEKRLEKALFEVKHYEEAFTAKKEVRYDPLKRYKQNLDDITLKYMNTRNKLDIKNSELSAVKADSNKKKEELVKLNEKIARQNSIIKDLRNTIKSINEDEKEKTETKKKSFLPF